MELENFTLDVSTKSFEDLLHQTNRLILDTYKNLDSAKAFPKKAPAEIRQLFDEPLPPAEEEPELIFTEIQEKVIRNSTMNAGPYFNAYVMSCSNQMGFIGDIISSFLNQNATKWHLGMAAAEMEQVVIKWIKEFIHLPVNAAGLLVSGGSAANLTCLSVARRMMSKDDI